MNACATRALSQQSGITFAYTMTLLVKRGIKKYSKNNIPSLKYRDTGILRYFVTLSITDNFSKNRMNSKKDK